MKTGLMCRLAAAICVWAAGAAAQAEPKPVSAKAEHEPGVTPDRVILTIAGDAKTTQAVTWRTSTEVDTPRAQIVPAGVSGWKYADSAKTVNATSQTLKSNLNEAKYHTVVFKGLKPGERYSYRVGDGLNWSEWFDFTTEPAEPGEFSFVYFGDAQNDVKAYWSRVIRQAYRDAPKANFLLHAGDLINRPNRDEEWGGWHQAGGWLNGSLPSIATPGNHEYDFVRRSLSAHWRPQFALPENGPEGLKETVYYIDYQNVRFVSLNSNEKQELQVPWLEKVLKENPRRWTIVTYHHPMYSASRGRDNPKLRKFWQPLFDKYGVDLALQGHDHTYGRSGLTFGENVAEGAQARKGNGTVYVVSVSGPKMYPLKAGAAAKWMKRSASQTQLYQIIHVDGDKLRYEAFTAVGDLYDVFELHKKDGGNELIEREELKDAAGVGRAAPAGGRRWWALVALAVPAVALGLLRLGRRG